MRLEIDHFFLLTEAGAPEADKLKAFGLTEGEPNSHPGQGTANRRFFFRNAFLELLWVVDPDEANRPANERTALGGRWSGRGRSASPFGVCFRLAEPASLSAVPPFSAWPYSPPYLPKTLVIHMGENSRDLGEPLVFFITFGRRPDAVTGPKAPPLNHRAGMESVTKLRLIGPGLDPASPVLRSVADHCPEISFQPGPHHLLEVTFDGERAQSSAWFLPALPLLVYW